MDINELKNYILEPAIQVAIIIGIVEVIKRLELLDTRFLFLLDLAIGLCMGIAIYYVYLGWHPVLAIGAGFVLGTLAAGTFSGFKNLFTLNGDPAIGNEEETEEEDYE